MICSRLQIKLTKITRTDSIFISSTSSDLSRIKFWIKMAFFVGNLQKHLNILKKKFRTDFDLFFI